MKTESKSRWTVIRMAAIYTGLCLVATYIYAGGIFYVELLDKYKEGEVKTNLVGTLNSASTCLFGPFAGLVSNRFSCRVSIVIGGILCSLGLFLSAWQSSIIGIILCHGVISGIGNAMTGIAFAVALGYYVEKHRDFFVSMSASAIGAGMFIATPLTLFLIDKYGISGTYMVLSAMVLHVCVLGMICKPSDIENEFIQNRINGRPLSQQCDETADALPTVSKITEENGTGDKTDSKSSKRQTVVSPELCLFLTGTFCWNFVLSVVQLHLPYYLRNSGNTNNFISVIMSCFSVSNAVGRLLSAFTVMKDNSDGLKVYVVSMIALGVCALTFPWYTGLYVGPYVFGVLSGFLTGTPNGVMPSITLKIVGLNNLSTGYAVGCFCSGIGILIGPIIASALFDSSGAYFTTFILSGIGNAMTGIAFAVALGYYVEKHRDFFVSMSASAIGAGMFIATPLALFLIDKYGISGTYMVLSAMVLHVCVLGMICKPSDIENEFIQNRINGRPLSQQCDETADALPTVSKITEENGTGDKTDSKSSKRQTVVSPELCLFLTGTFCWNFVLSVVQLHLPYYLRNSGNTNNFISVIMSCFSVSNAVGRLLSAFTVMKDNSDGLKVYVVSMIALGVCALTFPWYTGLYVGPYVFGVLSGFLTGTPNGVMPSITLKIVGLNNLSTGYAVGCFCSGIGILIGPIIASALFDSSGAYFTTFILSGCVSFTGSICSMCAKILQRSRNITPSK